MNIALITYQDNGTYHQTGLINEDDLLINFLTEKGLTLKKEIWNDQKVDWAKYDLIILKSPWDYFNQISDFYHWLSHIDHLGIPLLNPFDIVKWNADKHYLLDIAQAGLKVTESLFIGRNHPIALNQYFQELDTDCFIVKPAVSGGSKNTFKVTSRNAEEINKKLNSLIGEEDFIVQPFLDVIEQEGEWSFIFFGGEFSHALLKKAKSGDFRVQSTFGGTVHAIMPPSELLNDAKRYVDQFATNCLYARVDGAVLNQDFVLMELELIEPFLFLETSSKAIENYYQALKKFLR